MGQIKHKMGKVGGGVDISHLSKMSGKAKNLMSFPGGMPGPGEYGKAEGMPRIVGKGMAQYLDGQSVGMKKYGKHMGPKRELVGKQENLPEVIKEKIKAATPMYGKKEKAPTSGGPPKEGKRNADGTLMSPRQKRLAKEKADQKKKNSDLINKPFKGGKLDVSKSKKPMSDMQKIKASKKAKIESAKAKKAEGQSDLKKARETKFISRGSGEDSGVSTREERRTAIRAARSKKREGRRAERKARKGTVIKQKSVRMRKSDD